MKRIMLTTILMILIISNLIAGTNDSIMVDSSRNGGVNEKHFVLSLGYQPAVKADYFGASIFLSNALGPIGIYGSMEGIRTVVEADKSTFDKSDVGIIVDSVRNWHTLNFGISIETANNFFIYCGYTTGSYSDWITTKYQHTQSGKTTFYTVAKEKKENKPGVDFGAIYYAGTKTVRFGLQLGYNTAMQSIVAGIQMGCFIPKK